MFTAMFSAASIVWDREFGFLREMMVAPIRRSSIVIGKCFGGATVASFQGVILLGLCGLVDIPYCAPLILGVFGLQLLLAFSITAFGVMAAARVNQMQSFMGLMQMIVMPMFFLSGALFPVTDLPGWLAVPQPHRPAHLRGLADAQPRLQPPRPERRSRRRRSTRAITWFGWTVPVALEVLTVAALGLLMLGDRDLGVQRGGVAPPGVLVRARAT